jgi:hypothetical protein
VLLKALDETWDRLLESGDWAEAGEDPFSLRWGKTLLAHVSRFVRDSCGVTPHEAVATVAGATSKEVRLERFDGFVDHVDGNTAYVTLTDQSGETLHGEYAAGALEALGVLEHRRFRCETVQDGGEVRVRFERLPEEAIPPGEEEAINQRIDDLLADDQLDGDY